MYWIYVIRNSVCVIDYSNQVIIYFVWWRICRCVCVVYILGSLEVWWFFLFSLIFFLVMWVTWPQNWVFCKFFSYYLPFTCFVHHQFFKNLTLKWFMIVMFISYCFLHINLFSANLQINAYDFYVWRYWDLLLPVISSDHH